MVLAPPEESPHPLPWWTNPATTGAAVGALGLLAGVMASDETFRRLWGTPRFITGRSTLLAALCIGAFSAGAAFAVAQRRRRGSVRERHVLTSRCEPLARAFLIVALVGYVSWFIVGLRRGLAPQMVVNVARGNVGALAEIKAILRPVAGVTTLTQVAPGAFVLLVLAAMRTRSLARSTVVLGLAVGLLTLGRAFVYAERLALLEIAVPAVVTWAVVQSRRGLAGAPRLIVNGGPILAIPLLLMLFGTFEYFKSWSNYYKDVSSDRSYQEFVVDRLTGYYATSTNNAALYWREAEVRGGSLHGGYPFWSFQAVFEAPVVGPLLGSVLREDGEREAPARWARTLQLRANPEFNNQGGWLPQISELGLGGGLLYWFGAGLLIGAVYARLALGNLAVLPLYGVMFVGLLELPRFGYWALGRAAPALVAAALAARWVSVSPDDATPDEPTLEALGAETA